MDLNKTDIEMLLDCPRDFFSQPEYWQDKIELAEDRIAKCREAATAISCIQGDGSGCHGNYPSSKTETYIIKILELEKVLKQMKSYKARSIHKIVQVLNECITDSFDREIMIDYYVRQIKWADIAKAKGVCVYTLYKHQNKVFEEICKKLCTFTH